MCVCVSVCVCGCECFNVCVCVCGRARVYVVYNTVSMCARMEGGGRGEGGAFIYLYECIGNDVCVLK